MNWSAITASLLTVSLLSGCNSTPPPKYTYEKMSLPALNATSKAYLGDKMVSQGIGYNATYITVGQLNAYSATINAGEYVNSPESSYYKASNKDAVVVNNGFGNPLGSQDWVILETSKEGNHKVCVDAMTMNCFDENEVSITKGKGTKFFFKPNSFQQVIEYNGKSGQTLKFTYREYSNNMARSAYTTDFTIDLSEGSTVGYKGAIIEVIKASNNQIEYKVIRNFN